MIRRGRRAGSLAAAWGRGDETESLHTDVMRFMAILGLCLTAVFALVQSISVRESEPDAQAVRDDALQRESVLMEEKARNLRLELDQLTVKTKGILEDRELATQALTSAQEQLAVIINDTAQKTEERDRIRDELVDIAQELQQRRRELDRIGQVSTKKRDSLAAVSRRLEQEHKALDRIEERVRAVRVNRTTMPVPPVAEEDKAPGTDAAEQGLTLRFASPEALDRLVKNGDVTLYGMAGKQAWRLSPGTGSPVFVQAIFPRKFHEMTSATVPARYVDALNRSALDTHPVPVVWGVKLPPHTEQRIVMLTGQLTGGTLVIGPDGEVETRQNRVRE